MKGVELDRTFPVLGRVDGDKEILVVGTSFDNGIDMRPYEMSIDLLISDVGHIDFQKLLCGREIWDVEKFSGRGVANLNWMLHQLLSIMEWADRVGFKIISFEGLDNKRQDTFTRILRRHLKRYDAADIAVERICDKEFERKETVITIPSRERLVAMKVIEAMKRFNKSIES